MKFFLDSADIDQIREANSLGIISGVTTNPTLISKSGKNYFDVLEQICQEIDGPVSAEVMSLDAQGMIDEGLRLTEISEKIVVKLQSTFEGMKACAKLFSLKKKVNMTLCFSAAQALLAAISGASFISPFVGRLDDINVNGIDLVAKIFQIYSNYGYNTEIIVSSVRNVNHIVEAALIGAHISTVPLSLIKNMCDNALTEKGLEIFTRNWSDSGQKIL